MSNFILLFRKFFSRKQAKASKKIPENTLESSLPNIVRIQRNRIVDNLNVVLSQTNESTAEGNENRINIG